MRGMWWLDSPLSVIEIHMAKVLKDLRRLEMIQVFPALLICFLPNGRAYFCPLELCNLLSVCTFMCRMELLVKIRLCSWWKLKTCGVIFESFHLGHRAWHHILSPLHHSPIHTLYSTFKLCLRIVFELKVFSDCNADVLITPKVDRKTTLMVYFLYVTPKQLLRLLQATVTSNHIILRFNRFLEHNSFASIISNEQQQEFTSKNKTRLNYEKKRYILHLLCYLRYLCHF